MRGVDRRRAALALRVDLEGRAPASHPRRAIRRIADEAPGSLADAFEALDAPIGRLSIPPEMLLKAFHGTRSGRLPMAGRDVERLFRSPGLASVDHALGT